LESTTQPGLQGAGLKLWERLEAAMIGPIRANHRGMKPLLPSIVSKPIHDRRVIGTVCALPSCRTPLSIARLNTFDRHLLREWLQILGLVLLATLGLLLVQVMYNEFRTAWDDGARGLDLWMYFLVTIPSFFALVLPLALLISLMFALGQLHRANEFTAMRAAGVGFLRLTRPIWFVGVLCCGLTWWLNSTVVPWSVEESRSLEESFQFRAQGQLPPDRRGAVRSVTFDNHEANRMWFINRYSRFTRKAYGATVSQLDGSRREITRVSAAEAWRDEARGGWVFKDGLELDFNVETGEAMHPRPFDEKYYPDFHEDPALMLLIGRRAIDLSFFELRRIRGYFEADESPKAVPYAVRYFGLLADTLIPLIVIAIAIPFAVSGVRVNPAVGVSKSIGLFFLYYVLSNLAASLATKGLVPPDVAAWLPNASLTILAAWFFYRLR
jgi:lipopolysaccharide export system permease protein